MADQAPFAAVLASFAAELRSAGLAVGTGDVLTYCTAMSTLDPADLVDLYWAGRATLVFPCGSSRQDHWHRPDRRNHPAA